MRGRSVEDRISRLSGGAAQAAELISSHVGGAELLLGVSEHLTGAADSWAAQAAATSKHIETLRSTWQPLERVAEAERHAADLRREIELSLEPAAAPASPTSPSAARAAPVATPAAAAGSGPGSGVSSPAGARPPNVRGRRSSGIGALLGTTELVVPTLQAERFTKALHEAELAEAAARAAHGAASDAGKREEWRAAAADVATASGQLAVMSTLSAAATSWDAHRQAMRMRELRAARLE